MKKSAKHAGLEINPQEGDRGIGKWLTVTSDDLFKYDIDFAKINHSSFF